MVTFNALVSYVISPDERFRPSMTSIDVVVFFSSKANLYCHTSCLSMKHANAPKSRKCLDFHYHKFTPFDNDWHQKTWC
jgi:hypothetical protein